VSGWEGFYEEVPSSLAKSRPASLPDTPAKKLPEAAKLARMLRSGRTPSELSVRYGVRSSLIVQRLTSAGWDPSNGHWTGGNPKDFRPAPLTSRGEGPGKACHHVGGGDNPNGVPVVARPIRERPKPTGFAWPTPPDTPWQVTPRPKPPVRRRPRTFAQLREANNARRKLSDADLAEIKRRYTEEYESSVALARAFHVNDRTIRKQLRNEGVVIRGRGELGKIQLEKRRAERAASGGVA
jgi:hypothetical protein